jgi:hypothetical protein
MVQTKGQIIENSNLLFRLHHQRFYPKEFDHYIEGQTCYGLDKLILNNNYADATNMKEAVEDSFMLRNYGTEDGNEALQKTESGGV